MKDLIVDLRAARRRLESSPMARWRRRRRARVRRARTQAVAAVALIAMIGAAAASGGVAGRRRPRLRRQDKPAIAVLYFENNTGDESLDWMRIGLTDMMVTDLSQSTDFEVLGTDRLVQILQELNARTIASCPRTS